TQTGLTAGVQDGFHVVVKTGVGVGNVGVVLHIQAVQRVNIGRYGPSHIGGNRPDDAGTRSVQVVGEVVVRQPANASFVKGQSHAVQDVGGTVDQGAVQVKYDAFNVFQHHGMQGKRRCIGRVALPGCR